jgi:hypothetical protein
MSYITWYDEYDLVAPRSEKRSRGDREEIKKLFSELLMHLPKTIYSASENENK